MPTFERTETVKLRCVEIDPRHVSLTELEPDDCRYPYGGDQERDAITFCGHPRRQGSSYCAAHFHLTRGPGTTSKRSAGTVLLRAICGGWSRPEMVDWPEDRVLAAVRAELGQALRVRAAPIDFSTML